jgi:Phage tail lysozyme
VTNTNGQAAANAGLIARFLRGLGLNTNGTAGGLGNIEVESHFDPTAYNAAEEAIGLAQWEGGRRTALQNYASQTGGTESSLATQLGYLGVELRADPGLIADLNAAATPAAAAAIWDARFERSAGTTRAERMAAATGAAALAANPAAAGGADINPANWVSGLPGAIAGAIPGAINPIAPWVGKIAGPAGKALGLPSGEISQFLANAALKLTFIAAGAGLVVAGIYHTTQGARNAMPVPPAAAAALL